MSALYRRVRPLTFEELVGQEHVKEPLVRAIREGRLAQAYLFSGPRGVGKTTTARLLAMAVGCQEAERPCGVCAHCQAVQKGAHPDVVEIDAASNNSVEDVRELRERILLAPLSAPRKVFILDEAHMLSKSAFNALLKTLEEPPPHVLFIFATTEPERMPPTILSRTQHYRFRRLTEEEIAFKLQRILQEMGREAEEDALLLVARLSDGALRDAESLLDRLLLLEGPLTRKQVEEALGLPPREALSRLAQGLARGDLKEVLSEARGLYAKGFAPRSLVGGLMEVLREALYAAHGLPGESLEAPPEALLGALTALDEAMERLAKRSDLLALEAALLQAARVFPAASLFQPGKGEVQPKASPPSGKAVRAEAALPEEPAHLRKQEASQEDLPEFHPTKPLVPPGAREAGLSGEMPRDLAGRWRALLEALKPTLRAFLREARPDLEEGRLVLRFPESKAFHHKRAEEQRAILLPLVRAHFGVEEVAFLLEKKSLDPRPPSRNLPLPGEKRGRSEEPKASEPASPALPKGSVQEARGFPEGEEEPWDALSEPAERPPSAEASWRGEVDPFGQEAPAEDPIRPPEDPNRRLVEIARLLGARLLWVRRPRLPEAEEPLSEDDIGGTGI
ncbi:DNA polymerase III, subunit gamma and tau [Thermus scotoductus]|uniref:DNA polymerase III subunit gamma/tau n=1 Tax=Thermus scotoductus TaxID=37636 RepID=A0A430SEB0_THESC|nr:DNA polymerase III subunit gamma/tau [Thermus scotoductus]RTH35474.1 DNA polymerase III, subunit gamma and tau [Thermus scotoductus]